MNFKSLILIFSEPDSVKVKKKKIQISSRGCKVEIAQDKLIIKKASEDALFELTVVPVGINKKYPGEDGRLSADENS